MFDENFLSLYEIIVMVPLVLEVEVNGYFFIYLEFPSSLSSYQLKIINGDVESFFSYFLFLL